MGFIKEAMRRFSVALVLVGAAAVQIACAQSVDEVTLEQAKAGLESGKIVLIDIREPNEHAMGVAKGAKLLPMSQIGARLSEIPKSKDKPVYLICNTQNRSSSTLAQLRKTPGFEHVRFVRGGMSAWVAKGLSLVKPSTL